MFNTILIANRGEIACRVIATARRLGIRTVAVFSEADAGARHVRMADDAYLIGPAPARESYLVIEKILDVAKRSGAQAIHPGYGFLSENAEFAEACEKAGIVFVGPPPSAIRAMGLKDTAKKIMEKAGVPIVPGYMGANQDPEYLGEQAGLIGYPVLIKAVAGGGGKGMRRVDSPAEFSAALSGAQREALAAFGNDHVLIEKYLTKPRHIEVQVFGDSYGQAVHLFERDCSLQRRHQKVVEEAPAPDMPVLMRAAMGDAAVKAALAIGYRGAGTIEFIVDVANGLEGAPFYFMEMNTRLQVEHPVTEMITGEDLVEWQLRVAAGEPLPKTQAELKLSGHAFEVRLYAEDPTKGFLPATGKLTRLVPPVASGHVRFDTGVEEGDSVSVHYDPMIGKLVVWDHDRAQALRRLSAALEDFTVAGLTTNIGFLARVAAHPAFAAGEVDTGFIDRFFAELVPAEPKVTDRTLALATLARLLRHRNAMAGQAKASREPSTPWARTDGWRLNGETTDHLYYLAHDDSGMAEVKVDVGYTRAGFKFALPGCSLAASGAYAGNGDLTAYLDGEKTTATVVIQGDEITVISRGLSHRLHIHEPGRAADEAGVSSGGIVAPMPGKVTQVFVAEGEAVKAGQKLIILEAMKMEHTILAPFDGIIASLSLNAGDQIDDGETLIVVKGEDEE
jgi:3-methylcrotonyl-CoA carboxylase alpha subunit